MKTICVLHSKIRRCRKCRLCTGRKHAVPGEGPCPAQIMLIGQAPGRSEDKTGRPFIGRAGKFLDEMLTEAAIKRSECFITSAVKCFPPSNRAPKTDEINSCKPYLYEQLKLVRPKGVVLLGNIAQKAVLGTDRTSQRSVVHGTNTSFHRKLGTGNRKPITLSGITYFPTFHPAAGMRFPKIARNIVKDMHKLKMLLKR